MTASETFLAALGAELQEVTGRLVIVGGSTLDFLKTESNSPSTRCSRSVDAIAPLKDSDALYDLERRLRDLGFVSDIRMRSRWRRSIATVNIIPLFENSQAPEQQWFFPAISSAQLTGAIWHADAVHFLLLKLLASRLVDPRNSLHKSVDLEDAMMLIASREQLEAEIAQAPIKSRNYLVQSIQILWSRPALDEALDDYLAPYLDPTEKKRQVMERLERISKIPLA